MKRNFLLVFFISLIILFGLIYFLYSYTKVSEEFLRQEIISANYCSTKEDCVGLGQVNCISCLAYVNKDKVQEINKLIQKFDAKCDMLCSKDNILTEVNCVGNKCAVLPA